ncbi:MAG: alpha/beta hydrolase [Proteobacteria bacterium]|nr:alpha/beta hydrolase [Pseudomonadota bacterium]
MAEAQSDRTFLEVGGKRLETVWHGPGPDQAPTLVFLHEGLGCVELWRDFPARLSEAAGCGALVYSRLGYGRSDPCDLPRPVDFMHDEGLTVLPGLLDAAGVRECVLIGHSDGGSIALIYAGGTPAPSLRGVITEAAHVFCEELTLRSIREAREAFREGELRRRLEKYHGSNTDCAFWGWNGAWLNPDFKAWNIEAFLPGIRAPLLALQGRDDPYGTPAQIESIVRGAGGGAETVLLPGCGHTPHQGAGPGDPGRHGPVHYGAFFLIAPAAAPDRACLLPAGAL